MAKDGTKPAVNSNGVPLFRADFTKLDVKLDNEIVYEFGGPLGVIGMVWQYLYGLCLYIYMSNRCLDFP